MAGSAWSGDLPTSSIRVRVDGRGRAGRLELDLHVALTEAASSATHLRYDASARVSGLVARLGAPTLTVAGAHLTGCFFRDLDRALGVRTGPMRVAVLALAGVR